MQTIDAFRFTIAELIQKLMNRSKQTLFYFVGCNPLQNLGHILPR